MYRRINLHNPSNTVEGVSHVKSGPIGVKMPNLQYSVHIHLSQPPALCQTRPLHRMAVLKIAYLHGCGKGFFSSPIFNRSSSCVGVGSVSITENKHTDSHWIWAQEHKHNYTLLHSSVALQRLKVRRSISGPPFIRFLQLQRSLYLVLCFYPRLAVLFLPFQGCVHVSIHTISTDLNVSPLAKHFLKPCQCPGCGICLCKTAMAFVRGG